MKRKTSLKKLFERIMIAIVVLCLVSINPLQTGNMVLAEETDNISITIDNSNTHFVVLFYPDTNNLDDFQVVEIGATQTYTVAKDSVARIRIYVRANGYRIPDDYIIEGATKLTDDDKVNTGWCRAAYTITADAAKTIVLPEDAVCTHPYVDEDVRWGYYDREDGTHAKSCTLCAVDVANTIAEHSLSIMTPKEYVDWYYDDPNFAGVSEEQLESMKEKFLTRITEKLEISSYTNMKACTVCEHFENIDLKAPTISSVTGCEGKATIKWKKVDGATGYIVCRKTGTGSYKEIKLLKNGNTIKYVDSNVTIGKTYTYTVKAINGTLQSKYKTGKSAKIIKSHDYKDEVTKKQQQVKTELLPEPVNTAIRKQRQQYMQ